MGPHNILRRMAEPGVDWLIPDPGASGAIIVDRWHGTVPLVTAAAESRTLAAPTKAGQIVTLAFVTDGGDCTVTVGSAYDEAGGLTLVFTEVGQRITLDAVPVLLSTGTFTFAWRVLANDSVVGPVRSAVQNAAMAEVVITTNVIAASESGKTFYLSLAGGFTSTLPAPALGLEFDFIVKTAPTTAYIIVTTSSANIMFGMMEERAGTAGVAGAARDTFNFVANQAIVGDWVNFKSDGTNWYYHGMVDVAAGNTVAQT